MTGEITTARLFNMKPKIQKQKEALDRLSANITRTEQSLERYRARAKSWIAPVLKASSTSEERLAIVLLPKKNPFLCMIELDTRRLKRLEDERRSLQNKIAEHGYTGYHP